MYPLECTLVCHCGEVDMHHVLVFDKREMKVVFDGIELDL